MYIHGMRYAIAKRVNSPKPICFTGGFIWKSDMQKYKPTWSMDVEQVKTFDSEQSALFHAKVLGVCDNAECWVVQFDSLPSK